MGLRGLDARERELQEGRKRIHHVYLIVMLLTVAFRTVSTIACGPVEIEPHLVPQMGRHLRGNVGPIPVKDDSPLSGLQQEKNWSEIGLVRI